MWTRIATGVVILLAAILWLGTASPAVASEDPHGSEAEAEGTMPVDPLGLEVPFNIQRDLAIWTAVVFFVLLGALWIPWRKVVEALGKREQGIADDLAAAQQSNEEARRLLEEYERKLAASGEEVKAMMEAARQDSEKIGRGIVEEARGQAEAEHKRALDQIDLATADALKELAERSASLAVDLAGKIVGARLDAESHSRLIDQAVSNFADREPGKN